MNKFYITTAIDYVNDTIHIGHAFQKIAADVLARYYRIALGKDNVFFLTGTDEYGQKAEKAAKNAGILPLEFVRKISATDKQQQDSLNISYDRFIETTDEDHAKVAKEIWNRVKNNDDIYLGEYSGLYCEGCEAYYEESDLINDKCSFHPNLEIKKITEKNYFFKWSKHKKFLVDYIKTHKDFIFPKHRANEMLEFAKDIKDIPISRSNFTWGVPIPNESKQVMYVWFDALTNYLTGVGFLENKKLFDKFWPADIHILGKDNLRWHALLWPAMLRSAGIELPKTILVNGFLNINGQKISKSLGNIIRPKDWVKKYGAEKYSDAISNFKFNEALSFLWKKITDLDKLINKERPWELLKTNDKRLKTILGHAVDQIQEIAVLLQPFLPETAEKIQDQFRGPKIKSEKPLFPRIS
ncbi:methionine--tRNA ligase [Candidatus Roizmanbacteria bacterium]|nr:methionine--tRNA ligase [Candidatus Roizmanbacteria bacterium]